MIFEWIADIFAWLFSTVLGVFPTFDVPEWSEDVAGFVEDVNGYMVSVSVWFPFDLAASGLVVVGLALLAAFAIKVARIALSLFTAGGGSAG